MYHLHYKTIARKSREHKWHFLFQMLTMLIFLYCILLLFNKIETNAILGAIGISSIGASAFIVFTLPQTKIASPFRIIGGYFIAMMMGLLFHYFTPMLHTQYHLNSFSTDYALGGALAMTFTMLLMIFFEADHPPAAGFVLGLVLAPWNVGVFLIVSIAAILLAFIQFAFGKTLVNFL